VELESTAAPSTGVDAFEGTDWDAASSAPTVDWPAGETVEVQSDAVMAAVPAEFEPTQPAAQDQQSVGELVPHDYLTKEALLRLEQSLSRNVPAPDADGGMDTANFSVVEQQRLAGYKEAMAAGKLDPKSYLAARFRAAHKKGTPEGNEYAKLGRDESAEFRMKWAKLSFDDWRESKTKTSVWRRVDTTRGKYMSVPQLLTEQGDSEEAMTGIVKLIKRCSAMGPPWIRLHPQTEIMLYLLLDFQFTEDFDQSWGHYKVENQVGQIQPDAEDAPVRRAVDAPPMADDTAGARKAKGKAKAQGKKADPISKLPKTKFAVLWADANKMKVVLSKSTASAMELSNQINDSDLWIFARNPENKGLLDTKLADLRSKLSSFHRIFVTEDSAAIKKGYSEEHMTSEFVKLLALRPALKELDKLVDTLKKRKNI
jgi:hypothetical protein